MEKGIREGNARLTIDERVENKLAVLLDQVVDVTKDSAASIVSQPQVPACVQTISPHSPHGRGVARERNNMGVKGRN